MDTLTYLLVVVHHSETASKTIQSVNSQVSSDQVLVDCNYNYHN